MSLASEALHYRKGGVTYDVPLYTTVAEGGSECLAVRVGGNIRYVALPSVGDPRATALRVQRAGVIRSIGGRSVVYNPSWTLVGHSPDVSGTASDTEFINWVNGVSFNYDDLYSPGLPYNIMAVWRDVPAEDDKVSRVPQVMGSGSLGIWATAYGRISTGLHNIDCVTLAFKYVNVTVKWHAGGCSVYRIVPT